MSESLRECLRYEEHEQMGCGVCGAGARWTDNPQGEDYWALPCGHLSNYVVRTTVMTITTRAKSE